MNANPNHRDSCPRRGGVDVEGGANVRVAGGRAANVLDGDDDAARED